MNSTILPKKKLKFPNCSDHRSRKIMLEVCSGFLIDSHSNNRFTAEIIGGDRSIRSKKSEEILNSLNLVQLSSDKFYSIIIKKFLDTAFFKLKRVHKQIAIYLIFFNSNINLLSKWRVSINI